MRKRTQPHLLCYISSSSRMCWANAGHKWTVGWPVYCSPRECCSHMASLCNQKVKSGHVKSVKHAMLASLGTWWICVCPGFFLTTATLRSTAWLHRFVLGLKRSALQNTVTRFPPASWPQSRGGFREPPYQAATVCPLDFFPIGGNRREIPNVTEPCWNRGKKKCYL